MSVFFFVWPGRIRRREGTGREERGLGVGRVEVRAREDGGLWVLCVKWMRILAQQE